MAPLSEAQIIELFHVAFLDALSQRLDPTRYVLKGGANLRYFFGSVRYSEDLDLDMNGVQPWRMEEKVDGVLQSGGLATLLRVGGLAAPEFTKPKQTETTQRWKIPIEASGRGQPVRTKIEFSNRNGEDRYLLEAVPGTIVAPYALRSPSVQHYTGGASTEQKVRALAGRSKTQARDVFDLDLLLRRESLAAGAFDSPIPAVAAERAIQLPFAAFRDQVLPFLETDAQELYSSKEAWEQMQTFVVERLTEAQ